MKGESYHGKDNVSHSGTVRREHLVTRSFRFNEYQYYDLQAWIIPENCIPGEFRKQIREAEADLYIVGSSMVNTLSSLVAAHTNKPVLGVPISGSDKDADNEMLNTKGLPTGMPYKIFAINDFASVIDATKKLLI